MNYFHLTTELVVGFVALLLVTKILGKTQITQLTPFDFISALVLGELVGNAIYSRDVTVFNILYAVFVWGVLIGFVEWLTQKFRRTRAWLEGEPSIVIYKGKIDREAMKKNHLDLNQLQHLLRDKDVFSIREVEYAILESNGTINVLKKSPFSSPTRDDLKLADEKVNLPVAFILDGDIIWENVFEQGLTKEWLIGQLKVKGIEDVKKEVLYAEWTEGEALFIQKA